MKKAFQRFMSWITGQPTQEELDRIEFNAFANVLRKSGLSELKIKELWNQRG
jgi:hypothetical protein